MRKTIVVFNLTVLVTVLLCILFITKEENTNNILKAAAPSKSFEVGTRVQTNELEVRLRFQGEQLPYDTSSNTFYLPLNMQIEEWETGNLKVDKKDVSIFFIDDFTKKSKLEAIAKNEGFTFVAYTEKEYQYYTLVFTGLPMMLINTSDEKIDDKVVVDMKLYDSLKKVNWVQSSAATLRARGATSKNFPKLGFKLELFEYDNIGKRVNHHLSLLNMRKDDDWILYAMYGDDTKIRDKLSIDIWNEFGAKDNQFDADYGTKLEYIELMINGQYYGIYGLMEPVDAKKLKIIEDDNNDFQEHIYKRTTNSGLSIDQFEEEADATIRSGFELKGLGKENEVSLSSWKPLLDFIEINNEEDDATYAEKIDEVVDIDSAVNNWLFLQIISGHDNKKKNMYYVSKMTKEGVKLYFIPWDMDLTWGNVYNENSELYTIFDPSIQTKDVNWETGQRVIETNAGQSVSLLSSKWKKLRSTILEDEALIHRIENLEYIVINSGAMERDSNRWPDSAHTTDYTSIKQYAVDRMHYLDDYIQQLKENNIEAK